MTEVFLSWPNPKARIMNICLDNSLDNLEDIFPRIAPSSFPSAGIPGCNDCSK